VVLQIYALLNVGERFAVEVPFVQEMLPPEVTASYKQMFLKLASFSQLPFQLFFHHMSPCARNPLMA